MVETIMRSELAVDIMSVGDFSEDGNQTEDIVHLLESLHEKCGNFEKSFEQWQTKYNDITDDGYSELHSTSAPVEKPALRRRRTIASNRPEYNGYHQRESTSATYHFDEPLYEVDWELNQDIPETPMTELLERLRKTKERVTAQCGQMNDVIGDVDKGVEENCTLRERISMAHQSLILLERRQEKLTREALHESFTSNLDIRKLHDEVIELKIRDSQHQGDIQRLMAENARLKLKLMEARCRNSRNIPQSSALYEKNSVQDADEPSTPKYNPTPSTSTGLSNLGQLSCPVTEGVIQRAAMPSFLRRNEMKSVISSRDIILHENTAEKRSPRCPLCNNLSPVDEEEFKYEDGVFQHSNTRSIGTSTADIENIVALRSTVCIMGLYLPIPLFIACSLKSIDQSMAVIGRVCFAEFPPFDDGLQQGQADLLCALHEMRRRIANYNQ